MFTTDVRNSTESNLTDQIQQSVVQFGAPESTLADFCVFLSDPDLVPESKI